MNPGIHLRVAIAIERVHHCARLTERQGDQVLVLVPLLLELLSIGLLEAVKSALLFESDFELCEIEVLGVAEVLEEEPVHDFCDGLVAALDAAVGRHIEDDGVGRDVLDDLFEQNLRFRVPSSMTEEFSSIFALHRSVLNRQPQHLGKARLTRAEETRDPDRRALVGFVGRLPIESEDLGVMATDCISDHVLFDLAAEDLLIGLVHLDDFLDPSMNVTGEEVTYLHHRTPILFRRSWDGSCVRCRGCP